MKPESIQCAVVLVEFQYQWTEPGLFNRLVRSVMTRNNVIANTVRLTRQARALGVPVVHAPLIVDPKQPRGMYAHLTRGLFFRKGSRKGEIDARVIEDGDTVVTGRTTFNAFDGSNLAQVLTDIGATRPLFAGFATDQCVQKTFRCALTKGFDAYMVADCSATFFPWLQRKTERAAGDRAVSHAALHDLLRQPAEPG